MRKNKKIFFIILIITLLFFGIFISTKNINSEEEIENLINISECSEEFIDEYFEEINQIKTEERENILIITSEKRIKNTYGANKMIESPNNQYILQYDTEEKKNQALENFNKNDNIIYAEENITYNLAETQNDFYSWGIEAVGLDKALISAEGQSLDEVIVAVIDSGCNIDNINKYYPDRIIESYNVLKGNTNVEDNNVSEHGTHMAKIIAEGTPNNVRLLPIKVTEGSTIDLLSIKAALEYILNKNLNNSNGKIDVINMSFTTYTNSETIENLIKAANDANIICVAAAGNDSTSQNTFPASYENVISISACNSSNEFATFSNYGSMIDFAAPGVEIDVVDSKGKMSGTSAATPHAVSAVAVLRSYNNEFSIAEIMEILKNNAIDLGNKGKDNQFGYGLINLSQIQYCTCDCDSCNTIYCSECSCEECLFLEEDIVKEYSDCGWEYLRNDETKTAILTKCIIEDYDGISKVKINVPKEIIKDDTNYTVIELKGNLKDGSTPVSVFEGINLDEVILPETVTTIGQYAFFNSNLKNMDIKAEKIDLENYAFYGNTNLKKIEANINKLGYGAFAFCSNLEEVKFTDAINKIGEYAFLNCTNLDSVTLPESVNTIGIGAFQSSNINELEITSGVTVIEQETFYNCSNLEKIVIPDTVKKIGQMAFTYCSNLKELYISKNIEIIESNAFAVCSGLEKIEVDVENLIYDSRNNCNALIETENDKLIIAAHNAIIPDTIKVIGMFAFANNTRLNYIDIPENIKEIESLAFDNCPYLKEIFIPKSLETIGEYAISAMADTTIWVYKDSIAKEYAIKNGMNYKCIDPTEIEVNVAKEYKAFDKVNAEEISVLLKYDDGREEKVEENINIKYQNEELDSFRYGDTYFTISAINEVGEYIIKTVNIEETVEVIVEKAEPYITEEIPTGLKAKYGDKLSDVIIVNDSFTWKEPEKVIDKIGNVEFEAIYTPLDTQNYETVEVKINVEVGKADPDIADKIPTGLTAKYGDNLSDIILPDGFSWQEEGTVGNVGENTFKIKYTPKYEEKEYYNEIEGIEVTITVSQAIPEYEIPTNLKAKYGDELSDVIIGDDRFSWKNPEEIIDQIGEVEFEAIYTPIDTQNYETVNLKINVLVQKAEIDYVCEKDYEYDGNPHSLKITINKPDDAIVKFMDENGEYTLDDAPEFTQIGDYEIKYRIYANDNFETVEETQILKIFKKIEIINSTTDYEGIYDGKEHSIKIDINSTDYTIRYSVNNKNYNLTALPKFKEVGEYTINYKITIKNHNDIIGSNKVRIYGIKSIDSTIGQRGNILVIKDYNNSFKSLSNKIKIYAKTSSYKHYDVNKNLINSDTTKTGDKIKININGIKDFEYLVSVLGDVNGDGKISALDYVKIKNHIMKTSLISSDVYLISADVNYDGKISALDYVRIKNYIMNGGK